MAGFGKVHFDLAFGGAFHAVPLTSRSGRR